MALDGDLAMVGAPLDDGVGLSNSGSVRVVERVAGTWTETATLLAPSPASHVDFGSALSLDGSRVLVGAPYDDQLAIDAGAAHLFELQGGVWTPVATLHASDGATGDLFGSSVALRGDLALVGAPADDHGGYADPGSVYAFRYDPVFSTWLLEAKLTAADAWNWHRFGSALAVTDDQAVVGAPLHDGAGGDSGVVYVFDENGGAWSERALLVGSSTNGGDELGRALAVDGDLLAVGAPFEDGARGGAYLYRECAGVWTEVAHLTPFDLSRYDRFGTSVDVDGDRVAVGCIFDSDDGPDHHGSLYVFEESAWGWVETAQLVASAPGQYDDLGTACALDGLTALAGAPLHDVGSQGDAGAAYLFELDRHVETTPYGFCGAGQGPCGNDDPTAGCTNSSGQGARLLDEGTTSVSSDDLVLTATGVPVLQLGLIFMGGAAVDLPFGDGRRVVAPGSAGLYRFPITPTGTDGTLTIGPGIVVHSQGFSAGGRIQAGQTWHFQAWFRDPIGPCGNAHNLSSGLAVRFVD